MDYRKLLVALFLLLAIAPAFAAITVTVNKPTSGQIFYPNLVESDKCIDINYTVADNNASQSIHRANISYSYYKDGNTFISTDVNLNGGEECALTGGTSWSNATCHVYYCWQTHKPETGNYVLDVNIHGYDPGNTFETINARGMQTFSIDNRYISPGVEGLVTTIPVVIVAAILITIAFALLGVVSPKTVLYLLPALVVALIAIIVIAQITLTLTGV